MFVTGATGLLGGWLVRRLLQAGADVVCLVRDWVPQSELVRARLIDQVKVVRGDVRDHDTARTRARRIRDRHRHPSRGADDRRHRQSQSGLDVRNQHRRARGRCSKHAGAARSVKQIVVASSDKAYGEHEQLPYNEDAPLVGTPPLRRQQVVRRSDRAGLRRDLRSAGRDHALRQSLRRRRSELEPHRAGNDSFGVARPAAGDPIRWQVCARLFLCGRRRGGQHVAGRKTGRQIRG